MIDRLERLLNLVIALRHTRVPLTVEAINARVAGYGGERDESWRRGFERDKADLRALGIPIQTRRVDRLGEELGYTILPEDYDLPSVALDPAELTALALAVQLTGLGGEALPGLDKLAVDADAPGVQAPPERLPLTLSLDAPHRGVLTQALLDRRAVRFGYRKPGEPAADAARRHVDPHGLLFVGGRWYLRGYDHDRDDTRTFRLDRIVGNVRASGEAGAFELPDEPPDPTSLIPQAERDAIDAVVLASPEVAWTIARRARGAGEQAAADDGGWTRFVVRVTDRTSFLAWLLQLGGEAEVVEPPELRQLVVDHLRSVVAAEGRA